MRRGLAILTGTTASGKTSTALEWARQTGGWILSCDALLFYRSADIGTAKPTVAEREEIPHFGIDLCNPSEVFDLPRYIRYALDVLERAEEEDKPVLAVGGSGFYLASFQLAPPDPIHVPEEIRLRVHEVEETRGTLGLQELLKSIDPDPDIDVQNPRRLVPAIERCLTTGMTTRELRKRHQSLPCPFERWTRNWYQVNCPQDELSMRIQKRTEQMLENGLVDEVKQLLKRGILDNPTLCSAIGYRETLAHIEHPTSNETLIGEIAQHTEQLASRQRRWIRNRLPHAQEVQSAEDLLV